MWQWLEKLIYGEQQKNITYNTNTTFQINDKSTPDLRITMPLPVPPSPLQINVAGFRGANNNWGSPEMDAVEVYVTLAKSLEYVQNAFHGPHKWAAVKVLTAYPRAGRQINAYYDRKSLRYFYDKNPSSPGQILYLCESTDIVAHELGHALLDAIRPDFWNVNALEIWAFHEAFADINAIMTTGLFDQTIAKVLQETGGNLRKSNTLSKLAEDVGASLGMKDGLRNALNGFKYTNPNKLPANAANNKLSKECHSFGRVFLGAWYEVVCSVYDVYRQTMAADIALKNALQTSYMLVWNAAVKAPKVPQITEAVAKLMIALAPDALKPVVQAALARRNLGNPQLRVLAAKQWEDFPELHQMEHAIVGSSKIVTVPGKKSISLASHLPNKHVMGLMATGYNLANVEVEVASDSYYEFDAEGALVDQIVPNDDDLIEATRAAVATITSIGPYDDTMWAVQEGKLVRTYID